MSIEIHMMKMCERLAYDGDALHHKRSIRNVLGLQILPDSILLLGIGVYIGNEEELFDPDARITFDRTTDTVNIYEVDKDTEKPILISSKSVTMNTEEAKILVKKKKQNRLTNTMTIWLDDEAVILHKNATYEFEHNITPTDVVNHYSGWPITTLGADLWTCYGIAKSFMVESHGTNFMFQEPFGLKSGRSCLAEGQIPYFIFWKL